MFGVEISVRLIKLGACHSSHFSVTCCCISMDISRSWSAQEGKENACSMLLLGRLCMCTYGYQTETNTPDFYFFEMEYTPVSWAYGYPFDFSSAENLLRPVSLALAGHLFFFQEYAKSVP